MPRWRVHNTWVLLGTAYTIVFVLGLVGFTEYQRGTAALDPLSTRAYLTLQLFLLEGGGVTGPLPWQLDIARFTAPLVAAYAVVLALLAAFQDQTEAFRLRRVRGHVVVVGLDDTGLSLCRELLGRGRRVVGVDATATQAAHSTLRASGGLLVVSDARKTQTLRRAGVHRATNLIVMGDDDEATVEVVTAAREVAAERRSGLPLTCVALLADPGLWTLRAIEELSVVSPERIEAHFISALTAGSSALVARYPKLSTVVTRRATFILTGSGPVVRHILLAVVRSRGGSDSDGAGLRAVVVGLTTEQVAALCREHPEVDSLATVRVASTVSEAVADDGLHDVYICDEDPSIAATRTLELVGSLRPEDHVVVVQRQRTHVGDLLANAASRGAVSDVVAAGLLDEAASPEVMLTGTKELLAQALHRMYLEGRVAQGLVMDDQAGQDWAHLPETLRESNRDQAKHLAAKIAAVGRSLAPLTNWDDAQAALSANEVERLSEMEHERWVSERERQGWVPGPRDAQARTTPYLVPWSELPEDVRDIDRLFVRGIPRLLASIGLQLTPRPSWRTEPDKDAPRRG